MGGIVKPEEVRSAAPCILVKYSTVHNSLITSTK